MALVQIIHFSTFCGWLLENYLIDFEEGNISLSTGWSDFNLFMQEQSGIAGDITHDCNVMIVFS